ncbi:unannotated protein [freshwater metagenome]|uniref:Unannotated protein n=1 Tax=freshwater metagenome TaxID=449393 RepID=A0A6J7RRY3_9ZZZZ
MGLRLQPNKTALLEPPQRRDVTAGEPRQRAQQLALVVVQPLAFGRLAGGAGVKHGALFDSARRQHQRVGASWR